LNNREIPTDCYGILRRNSVSSGAEKAAEQIKNLGYAVIDSGFSHEELNLLSENFNAVHSEYTKKFSADRLRQLDEEHTIRALFSHSNSEFLQVATNVTLHEVIDHLILGAYILNQQNGVINPPGEKYNQGSWHRDLPYQHFTSSRPLAINALFCLDDFSLENGATYVLPASHLTENFPSESFLKEHAIQVTAKAGSYILLNCMVFHSGGYNRSLAPRRAVNQVFTIPYFRQQISLPSASKEMHLSEADRNMLGYNFLEPQSIDAYFLTRMKDRS
jgi:ectoine hydroxylase-related dioxygenase (phytanoyl-CoA dioxygenase family)